MFEKRAWHTHHAPKPANGNFENAWFSKSSFAGLGALWVCQALFSKISEKFEKFKTFFIPWSFSLDKNSLRYWKVKISENAIFLRDFQNFHLQVWVRCGCAKPFFQKFLKSSKILEYFSYLDRFHSTKTRWDIGRSKSVKTPYFCVIFENFICRFGCVGGAPSPFFKNFRKVRKI